MKYCKSPTTIHQQLELLKSRNMTIEDEENCARFLSKVSYYKLRGYWIPFELKSSDKHSFKAETTLDSIIDIYELDFSLRPLIFKIIGELEISIKANFVELANVINIAHIEPNIPLSHFYLSQSLFSSSSYSKNISYLLKEFESNKSKLVFIDAYKSTYTDPKLPPIWSAVELMTFGDIAKWIRSLDDKRYSDYFAKKMFWQKKHFDNFLFMTTTLRNICAHHGKLFDSIIYGSPLYNQNVIALLNNKRGHKLWNSFVMIIYVLQQLSSNSLPNYIDEFTKIIVKKEHFLMYYGFPKNWLNILRSLGLKTKFSSS